MRQTDLLRIVMGMEKGHAYKLTKKEILGCADDMLISAFDGPPRQSDIENFIKSASQNWGVKFVYDPFLDTWTIHKVGEA